MFAYCIGSETWPSGKISVLDGLNPGGWNWIATGSMHELKEFGLCGSVIGTVGLCGSIVHGICNWHWAMRVKQDFP